MCMGVPMQVVEAGHGWALCDCRSERRRVDTLLLDEVKPGDWLLVHIDSAVRVIDAEEAQMAGDALLAIQQAAAGLPYEHLLADLINREPQLPPHLRKTGN